MRVEVLIREGPLKGQSFELNLGRVTLGREPGGHGLRLVDDPMVSDLHGELREETGQIVYVNHSPNGSAVDGITINREKGLTSGSLIRVGESYLLEIRLSEAEPVVEEKEPIWRSGRLKSPAVRLGLVGWILALLGLVYVATKDSEKGLVEQFQSIRKNYLKECKEKMGLSETACQSRIELAEDLVSKLEALERRDLDREARRIYDQLIAIDGDFRSPIYHYAVRNRGKLGRK